MVSAKQQLISGALSALGPAPVSLDALAFQLQPCAARIHLAIMRDPYLSLVLAGKKTIESRLTRNSCAPFGMVRPGDYLLLKRTSGPIQGLARVMIVDSAGPTASELLFLRMRKLQEQLQLAPEWLEFKREARYMTLLHLGEVRRTPDVLVKKRDRRPWVPLITSPASGANSLLDDGQAHV